MAQAFIDFALQKRLHATEGELWLAVDAQIPKGSFVSLYGPSGAGKTSILRMLAGLMQPDEGYVRVGGETWFDAADKTMLSVQKRGIGFVFQDAALFPHQNVRENIAFAQKKGDDVTLLEELLVLTGLENLAKRQVETLSGGQRQRVALARALAGRPKLLLLDEPLSALDSVARSELQELIAELHQRFALTTVLVSHHPEEIIRLSDAVYALHDGRFLPPEKPTTFFMDMPSGAPILGMILDIDAQGRARVLIENRLLEVQLPEGDWKRKDRVKMLVKPKSSPC